MHMFPEQLLFCWRGFGDGPHSCSVWAPLQGEDLCALWPVKLVMLQLSLEAQVGFIHTNTHTHTHTHSVKHKLLAIYHSQNNLKTINAEPACHW